MVSQRTMAAQTTERWRLAHTAFRVDEPVGRAGRATTDVTRPDPVHQDLRPLHARASP